jgi:RNA polymerase sigma-70 factor (ECF subfamily)
MADRPRETASARAGRLYDEFGSGLYRYAVMLLADAGAAEDALQQVFAALLRHSGTIDNEAHYLRRAVRNECYSMLRRRVRRGGEALDRPLLEPAAAEGMTHAERLALEAAIRELPPEQREVVHLHVFEGWTFQEVADGCGESINTVASRYRYALARLREALAPR